MKHIKTFENIKDEPQVGDYVYCDDHWFDDEFEKFITNSIGRIIDDDKNDIDGFRYTVRYKKVPDNIKDCFSGINNDERVNSTKEIIFYGKSKEEVELKLKANNYNL